MIYKITDMITNEVLSDFIDAVNQMDSNGESMTIYINSGGGDYEAMEAMLDIINSNHTKYEIVGFGCLSSSAFELFFRAACQKDLIGGCRGMFHQAQATVQLGENGNSNFTNHVREYLEGYLTDVSINLCKDLKFTPNEIKKFKAGNDMYFSVDRMKEFLKINLHN